MLYAKKGNRQIQINKDHQTKYEKLGYVILDFTKGKGKKIISKPENVKDLKAELGKAKKLIGELQAEIKILKTK